MTEEQFLDDLALREGLVYAEPPTIDQPTAPYGITLPALSSDRGRPCTLEELKALTPAEGRDIARRRLRSDLATFKMDRITDEHLRYQLLDFAHNSGPGTAIRGLQRALGMPKAVCTGVIDDRTLGTIRLSAAVPVNNALVAFRLRFIDDATDPGGKVDKKFEEGLENRALSFGIFDL